MNIAAMDLPNVRLPRNWPAIRGTHDSIARRREASSRDLLAGNGVVDDLFSRRVKRDRDNFRIARSVAEAESDNNILGEIVPQDQPSALRAVEDLGRPGQSIDVDTVL